MGTDVCRFPKALAWGRRGQGGFLVPEEHPGRAMFGSCCLVPEGSTLSQVSPVGTLRGPSSGSGSAGPGLPAPPLPGGQPGATGRLAPP